MSSSIPSRTRAWIVVTLVTIFLWTYAESESLRRMQRTITLRVVSPEDGSKVAWIGAQRLGSIDVELRLEGATASLDGLSEPLSWPMDLVLGASGVPSADGTHEVLLRDVLRLMPALRSRGVTLDRVDPPAVQLVVRELVPISARIRPVLPSGVIAQVEAVPASVRLLVPSEVATALGVQNGRAQASSDEPAVPVELAVVVGESQMPRLPGTSRLTGLAVQPPPAQADWFRLGLARVEPAAVDLLITVREQTATRVLATVPVHVRVPASALDEFRVEFIDGDFLTDVRLTGSADVLALVTGDRPASPLFAYVSLLFDDLRPGEIDRPVRFSDLPMAGLTVTSPTQTKRLRITPRQQPTVQPPPGEPELPTGPGDPEGDPQREPEIDPQGEPRPSTLSLESTG